MLDPAGSLEAEVTREISKQTKQIMAESIRRYEQTLWINQPRADSASYTIIVTVQYKAHWAGGQILM